MPNKISSIGGKLDTEPVDQKWEQGRHRVEPLVDLIFADPVLSDEGVECISSKEK